ncbi:MAG: hypothetical protein WD669_09955 [Pirellulales bacterium]
MFIYIAVAVVAVGAAGAERLHAATTKIAAPLEIVSRDFPLRVHWLVSIGAMTAMLGVLLNLLLGLSRVLLAMGRRGDMPSITSNAAVSVLSVASVVAALAATGSVKTTWSFSAFSVLIYYAVTNLAALRLPDNERIYAKAWAWGGIAVMFGVSVCDRVASFGWLEWEYWDSACYGIGSARIRPMAD